MNTRLPNRLAGYDYSQNGIYFLTVCTKEPVFWDFSSLNTAVGATCGRPPLSPIGMLAKQELAAWEQIYPDVRLHNAVIMPDHIHLLLELTNGRPQVAPTVSRIMQQFKGKVTKLAGRPIWQKSYYDHVIRDENDFLTKWNYMENNPAKWLETHRL